MIQKESEQKKKILFPATVVPPIKHRIILASTVILIYNTIFVGDHY
jgi:hypothetical protein